MIDDDKDMCPICKTDRYLLPNMTFLINPECYHKICESCVDRIFSLGPSPCPYPKCGRILRRNRFKKQVFEDIKIEKEVDIRRRVQAIYNKTEGDFESLSDYNAYLENVENMIFNFGNGIDVAETEAQIKAYEKEHKIEILEIAMRELQKSADLVKYQEAMENLKQEKLNIQKQMEVEDAEFQQQQKAELMEMLSLSSGNAEEIMKQQKLMQIKRTSLRKRQLQQISEKLDEQFTSKVQPKETPELTPFTPFQGDRDIHKGYTWSGDYTDPFVNKLAKNKEYLGGGWRIEYELQRALDEAFLGLNCFIQDKVAT